MDEEALRDLEFDVDEEKTITIAGDGVLGGGGEEEMDVDGDVDGKELGEEEDVEMDGEGEEDLDVDAEGDEEEELDGEEMDAEGEEMDGEGEVDVEEEAAGEGGEQRRVVVAARKLGVGSEGEAGRKRTRSEVAAAAAETGGVGGRVALRRGVRSSARRR